MSQTQASLLGDTFGSKASGTIPVGGIIMWSGSIGTIPTGWALCNGSNGTPNLQDKFIVGAGSGYSVAGTGGSADATLVSHSHSPDPTPTFGGGFSVSNPNGPITGSFALTPSSGGSFGEGYSSPSTSIEGFSATNANLPPYYALAFIMRTS
jgi:hypothetical protein